jgi:hypothetical protein
VPSEGKVGNVDTDNISENDSDWTWTTATTEPTPPPVVDVMPPQEELWEAIEDGDLFDTTAIIEENETNLNFKYTGIARVSLSPAPLGCG